MRTVTLDFTRSEMLAQMDFSDRPDPTNAASEYLYQLDKVLVYLIMWGETAQYVSITSRRDGEMVACYSKLPNERPFFVMGAIWRDDEFRYTTHS